MNLQKFDKYCCDSWKKSERADSMIKIITSPDAKIFLFFSDRNPEKFRKLIPQPMIFEKENGHGEKFIHA